uniref:Uncharacterized protein n=1 Tax=Amphimedon queenslandica TaxID=400682 RepID=A0A1X7VX89_AMPQE
MAFSCLFPNGVNCLHTARDPPITFTDYIQSHLLNADNRSSSNIHIDYDHHHHWVAQDVSLLVHY